MNSLKTSPTTFTGVEPQTTSPFSDLPDLMKQILGHEENTDINMQLEEKHLLTPEQGDAMMKVIRGVILKNIPPQQLVAALEVELQLGPDQATSLARDLLGLRFLPMEWYIGQVQPLIQQLGGNLSEFMTQAQHRYPEVFTAEELAAGGLRSPSEDYLHLLTNFEDWVGNTKGKAEILLRLTNLSTVVEQAVQAGDIEQAEGEKLLSELDAVSYAINTQDLNTFETHSLKRQIERFLDKVGVTQ